MERVLGPGHIVRFRNPLPHEDPKYLFLIKEAHYDVENPRGLIQDFTTKDWLKPTFVILLNELELMPFETDVLLGKEHSIILENKELLYGTVTAVSAETTELKLSHCGIGVVTNIEITISDRNQNQTTGQLFFTKSFLESAHFGR